MTKDEIELTIRRSVNSPGFRLGKHCRDRMTNRSVKTQDLVNVLDKGEITEIEDLGEGKFKCKVEGKDLEGDPLAVRVGLDGYGVKCITMY